MLHVGLTGGIASGKSAVAGMMLKLGCVVLEADTIAHRLIEPGQPAYEEVIEAFEGEFGELVRATREPGGRIVRAKLAAIVFADPAKLERLNRILHPRVLEELERELAEVARTRPLAVAVVEAALLVEAGYHKRLDRLAVAWCKPEQQFERLLARGLTREEAERRVAAQMGLDAKRRMADDQIDCSGTLEETRRQVESLVVKYKKLAAERATPRPR